MISIPSLKGNIIPNVYTKNITLNSTYLQKVTPPTPGFYDKSYGNVGLNFASDVTDPTTTIGNVAMANLTLSVKFVKDKKYKNDLLLLLDSEMSDYVKIYVHQITDKATYQSLLQGENGEILTTENGMSGVNVKTKVYTYSSLLGLNAATITQQGEDVEKENARALIEQTLDDGTTLLEGIVEADFRFNKNTSFLAYVLVPAVKHPDFDETILGNITADILILDGQFQNQGLVFKIAPTPSAGIFDEEGNNITSELLQFGNPGDIWVGPVHEHDGRYMAGAKHNPDVPHPFLDYEVVPVTKFIDNRVTEKIEKNVINVTKVFEKLNSLSTKYKNSSLNLADFKSYKKVSFISDLWLTQDSNFDIQGAFVVNKKNLVKEQCAFPFLFDNIEDITLHPTKKKALVQNILDQADLLRMKVFENETMLDTMESKSFNTNDGLVYAPRDSRNSTNIKVQMITSKDNYNLKKTEEMEEYSFRVYNHNNRIGDFTYKVEVEYRDPTIELVKSFLPLINEASKTVGEILTYAQLLKGNATVNAKPGFDSYTKKLNPEVIDFFKEQGVAGAGGDTDYAQYFNFIKSVVALSVDTNFRVFFHNPASALALGADKTTAEFELRNYLFDLSCLESATLDSLLVLQKFLNNLETKVYDILNSFGSKPTKISSQAGNEYAAKQSPIEQKLSNRSVKGSTTGVINILDYGYDFTGFIEKDKKGMNLIKSDQYNTACLILLQQLVPKNIGNNPEALQGALDENFKIKLKGEEAGAEISVSGNAFSGLNIPASAVKSCVSLPKTVLNIDSKVVTIENIFTSILKFNNDLFVNNSQRPTLKNSVRKDLDSIFNNLFGATMSDTYQKSNGALDVIIESGEKDGMSIQENDFDPGAASNKQSQGVLINSQKSELINPNNFLLLSLMTKMLLEQTGLKPHMSLPDFAPLVEGGFESKESLESLGQIMKAPLQVKCLSIYDNQIGPLKDFLNTDQFYIKEGVINPLFLCYYWFIHQNLALVLYLDGFETTKDSFEIRSEDSPYTVGQEKIVTETNMKSPQWNVMTLNKLSDLKTGEKMLCKIVKYEGAPYVDKKLTRALNLPLHNNYFIIEGS